MIQGKEEFRANSAENGGSKRKKRSWINDARERSVEREDENGSTRMRGAC